MPNILAKKDDSQALVNIQMPPEETEVAGVVKVHESVIASITRKAACSVDGVIRLAGSSFVDNIAEMVGSKKMFDRSIVIDMNHNSVQIEVRIVAAIGEYLPDLAAAVQEAIMTEVNNLTGMPVSKVNVLIMDVDDVPNEESEEE